MKRIIMLAAALLVASATGCATFDTAPTQCDDCQGHGVVGQLRSHAPTRVGQLPQGYMDNTSGPMGPPSPSYAYPYYTTRAPRDFLMSNPPTIGN